MDCDASGLECFPLVSLCFIYITSQSHHNFVLLQENHPACVLIFHEL